MSGLFPVYPLGTFLGLHPRLHPVIGSLPLTLSQITDTDTNIQIVPATTYNSQTSPKAPNDDVTQ